MSSSSRLTSLRQMYDKRAPTYDQEPGFHPKQAADYIKWMSIEPGFKILDLACGTGAITIPAAKEAGPSGSVTGVDISPVSLKIAREKASMEGLDIVFIEHDIEDLQGLEAQGIEEGKFDLITVASAFALLLNQPEAVKSWAKLLKKGGRLIFDTPTKGSLIKSVILERVATELKLRVFDHAQADTIDKVQKLLKDAGLDPYNTFVVDTYDERTETLEVEKAEEIFDTMFREKKWIGEWYGELAKPDVIDQSRKAFRSEIEKLADKDGKVSSYVKLNMAMGRKL